MGRSPAWKTVNRAAERFSASVAARTGGTLAFAAAFAVIVVWLASGPLFGFSDSWQLAINSTTTIVTFLMVFLIQRAQNKEARAVNLKLNELIAAVEGASNRLIDVEDLSEEELEALHRHFQSLVRMAKRDGSLTRSHSVEEAKSRHQGKRRTRRRHGGGGGSAGGRRGSRGEPRRAEAGRTHAT